MLKFLFEHPMAFILNAIPILYAIIFHELAHGWAAYRLGDPTAKMMGRLSLNPLKHLDPIGTLMLFLVRFGWAKPVPVNFSRLRGGAKGMIMVSAAGVVANMLMAFIALFLLRWFSFVQSSVVGQMLYNMAQINIILAAFNLIPIPPLDGSKIVMGFVPPDVRNFLLRIEPYGFFIIIGLLVMGWLNPVIEFFLRAIISFISILLP